MNKEILSLTTEQAKVYKWLNDQTPKFKENHPTIERLSVIFPAKVHGAEYLVGVDGYNMAMVKYEPVRDDVLPVIIDKPVRFDGNPKRGDNVVESIDEHKPMEVEQVIPTSKPTCTVYFNTSYLLKMLKNFPDDIVKIDFHDNPDSDEEYITTPVVFTGDSGKTLGIAMPTYDFVTKRGES